MSKSDPESGSPPKPTTVPEWVVIPVLLVFLAFLLRTTAFTNGPFSIWGQGHRIALITDLLFGWILFPFRTWPQIRLDADGIAVFIVTACVLVFTGHRFLVWLYPNFRSRNAHESWKKSWSVLLLLTAILLFTLTVSVSGVYHTLGWLASPSHPFVKPAVVRLPSDMVFDHASETLDGFINAYNSVKVDERPIYADAGITADRQFHSYSQVAQSGFITRPDGTIYAGFIIPHDPVDRATMGICIVGPNPHATGLPDRTKADYTATRKAHKNWPAILEQLQSEANAPSTQPSSPPLTRP